MARLVIVSNRVALPRDRSGRAGGLAVALREALAERGGLWFGWSGEVAEGDAEPRVVKSGRVTYATIDLSAADHEAFYLDFSNSTLWPLCHYRPGFMEFRRSAIEGYHRVNALFAEQLAALLRDDDTIWIHDYHFIPLAAQLRRRGVKNRIGFFLHIPFPAPELLVTLPGHERLMAEFCACDLVGLQTERDVRAFRRYFQDEVVGARIDGGAIAAFGLTTRVEAFPIGIDTERFAGMAKEAATAEDTERLRGSLSGRNLVIGVDRLDYTKGLVQRLAAFEALLAQRPEHRGRVTFLQIAPISRGEVARYRTLRRELEGVAGRINGRYSEFDWTPVRYLNSSFARPTLAGFYRIARVGLVTPIRDGMNLVAMEYVAAQDSADPGVLVLSRFAGAAEELAGALLVNPLDVDGVAEALHGALTMPLDERIERWGSMMCHLRSNTVTVWRKQFLAALEQSVVDAPAPLRAGLEDRHKVGGV